MVNKYKFLAAESHKTDYFKVHAIILQLQKGIEVGPFYYLGSI